jgi:hypothetical protein
MNEYNKCEVCGEKCLLRFCSEKCYVKYKNIFIEKELNKPKPKRERKVKPPNPKHKKDCVICGKKCREKYCSVKCKRKGWKKSEYYKKNKCTECGKPCIGDTLCRRCYLKFITNKDADCCLQCCRVLHTYVPKDKERRYFFCSDECKKTYNLQYHDFFYGDNVNEIYHVMGMLFYYGWIYDFNKNEIHLNTRYESEIKYIVQTIKIADLNTIEEETVPVIISEKWLNYLYDVGFSHSTTAHTFPIINKEFVKYFINGYINRRNTKIIDNGEYNLIIIKGASYDLIRGITDFTEGELNYEISLFTCTFKDYEKFYTVKDK